MKIRIKTHEDIKKMIEGGQILKQALDLAESLAIPGKKTKEIDQEVEQFIRANNAIPGFKGYNGFPATICSSINDEVVHGIPSEYELQTGDLFSVDCGVFYKGFFTDSARTIGIGDIKPEANKLMKITKDSLYLAIDQIKEGINLKEIATTIQGYVEKNGFQVVKELVGHGIGKELHEDPQIPNYVPRYPLPNIKNGMTFCIEPMVNIGSHEVIIENNSPAVRTKDGSLSAHYEHTIAFFNNQTIIVTG
jgi:methionyl aminopeptidase